MSNEAYKTILNLDVSRNSVAWFFLWDLQKDFEVTKMLNDWNLKGTGVSCKLAFFSTDKPVQDILRKIKKSSKVRQNRKTLWLFLRIFWSLVPEIYFHGGDKPQGCVNMQFWDFHSISLFSRILSLKSLGNLWGNL